MYLKLQRPDLVPIYMKCMFLWWSRNQHAFFWSTDCIYSLLWLFVFSGIS